MTESGKMRRVIESGAEVARLLVRMGIGESGVSAEELQNQRVRPLLIDRRRKVYHCRNAI